MQMTRQRLVRIIGLGALAFIALGAIGIAFNSNDDNGRNALSVEEQMTRDAVMEPGKDAIPYGPADCPNCSVVANESGVPPIASGGGSDGAGLIHPDQPVIGPTDPVAFPAPSAQVADDRQIIQTAALHLQVEEVGPSFEDVGRIATASGGFVASSTFSQQDEHQIASVTVRVPADRYHDVLVQFRALGVKIDSESSDANDVTEEYSDLNARLRNLEATETQLLELLGRADTIGDILQVQDRLNSVRSEIEQVKGRIVLLDKLTDLATITVHLRPEGAFEPVSNGNGVDLGAEVREAWEASLDFLGNIAAGAISVVVFAWWVPVVGIPAYVIGTRWLRSRPISANAVD
jgi:hypothetical protein